MKQITEYFSEDGSRKSVILYNEDTWCYVVYRYYTNHTKTTPKVYEFPTLQQAENMAKDWVVEDH